MNKKVEFLEIKYVTIKSVNVDLNYRWDACKTNWMVKTEEIIQ